MSSRSLEGAACAEISPLVVDKFFENGTNNRLYTEAAKRICAMCVVRPDCLVNAMSVSPAPERGIVAGYTAHDIQNARAWRRYELGIRDTVPSRPRPEWLWMNDATNTVEQGRLEVDQDETQEAFA